MRCSVMTLRYLCTMLNYSGWSAPLLFWRCPRPYVAARIRNVRKRQAVERRFRCARVISGLDWEKFTARSKRLTCEDAWYVPYSAASLSITQREMDGNEVCIEWRAEGFSAPLYPSFCAEKGGNLVSIGESGSTSYSYQKIE